MGRFINYLFNKTLDFAESRFFISYLLPLFQWLVFIWAGIWLVMVPAWNILWFWITYIKDIDSSWSFLWGVLFWILGAIVVFVGVFILSSFARYIGLDDK